MRTAHRVAAFGLHWGNDFDDKATTRTQCTQRLRVPRPAATKPVIVPDEQLTHLQPITKQNVDELIGRMVRQRARERENDHVIDLRAGYRGELFGQGRQKHRGRVGLQQLEGVRLERQQDAVTSCRARACDQSRQHVQVPSMHAIEGADRHDRLTHMRGQHQRLPRGTVNAVAHACTRCRTTRGCQCAPCAIAYATSAPLRSSTSAALGDSPSRLTGIPRSTRSASSSPRRTWGMVGSASSAGLSDASPARNARGRECKRLAGARRFVGPLPVHALRRVARRYLIQWPGEQQDRLANGVLGWHLGIAH